METLVDQRACIITEGADRGEFAASDPLASARAAFNATARFHNPVHAPEWSEPQIGAAYQNVRAIVLAALKRTVTHGHLSHRSIRVTAPSSRGSGA